MLVAWGGRGGEGRGVACFDGYCWEGFFGHCWRKIDDADLRGRVLICAEWVKGNRAEQLEQLGGPGKGNVRLIGI